MNGPRRIVCLCEEPTEILYALGEGDRVVGISAYTVRPPEAREKPVVSAFIDGNVRKIRELEPDLIIGFSDIQAKLASELIAAGEQVLVWNQRSLDEILAVVRDLGALVGREDRALELIAGYRANLARAAERAATLPRRPRVYFEEWPDPIISGIRWVSQLIEVAGGEDVFAEQARGSLAKERIVTAEEVCAAAPELYLASWCGKPFDRDAAFDRPGFRDLPAVSRGQVHELDPAIILQPGPACLTDGLDAIADLVAGAAAD